MLLILSEGSVLQECVQLMLMILAVVGLPWQNFSS